jgi:hypothetical protein
MVLLLNYIFQLKDELYHSCLQAPYFEGARIR